MSTTAQAETPHDDFNGTLDNLSPRDQEIVRLLASGSSRKSVAEKYDLTSERVRQISVPFQDKIHELASTSANATAEANHQGRIEQIKALAEKNPNMRVAVIAAEVKGGVTSQDVIDVLGEADSLRRTQARFTDENAFSQRFTNEDCFKALRATSLIAGQEDGLPEGQYGVLTMNRYGEIAPEGSPKKSTIQKRFGTWKEACDQAGVPSGEPIPLRVYEKRWSHEEMKQIVRAFFKDVGVFGSMRDYRDWAQGRKNTPTIATVRSHFGSWTKVKEIAADLAED